MSDYKTHGSPVTKGKLLPVLSPMAQNKSFFSRIYLL